jgi:hypothetical protein
VCGQVVADHVDDQAGVGLAVELIQDVAEVDGPVLGEQAADHVCQTSGDSIRLTQAFAGKGVTPLN